ncbi:ImmA/IrrE family metallo-endopeptidase [Anaeromassilibacillus senegalensis]|uniref:ImmA/IrrE family metallo-endopeptidase n=1 Tax=Anaeromassilibacillus senegalensis TaxID=1673717 RepID=UPI000682F3F9|nr:ImmA/IrrE family metallo-endopeptidase [Anaeromassilibacillus senegalensis]
MNEYKNYKAVRNTVWKCLIDNHIQELPVKTSTLANNYRVKIIAYKDAHFLVQRMQAAQQLSPDGFCVCDRGYFTIYYNETAYRPRLRFTIAHELGHILMGHPLTRNNIRTFNVNSEWEADIFASRLLAPACILHEIHALDAETIACVCDISYQAAKIRAQRMATLEQRNAWYKSPLEIQVIKQFGNYISSFNLF